MDPCSFLGVEKEVFMKHGKLCLGPAMRMWPMTSLAHSIPFPRQLEQVEMLSHGCLWKPPWFTFSTRISSFLSDYATTSRIPPRALSLNTS